jgi:hypothetical protein
MITDLLDLSKGEAGRLELLPAPFDIRACVDSVAQMIRLRAEEKGLGFTVEISDDVPHQVSGDGKRIRQVLINLLGNAIKFTAAGEVRLEVSTVSWESDIVRLRFDVLDTGAGIRSDQLDLIFQPFEQVGTATERSGGTGLGLSITREIVEVMHGSIEVVSTVGEGSRFRVEAGFPLAAVGLSASASVSGAVSEALARPGVPVVEDVIEDLPGVGEEGDGSQHPMAIPPADLMARLLTLARAGNMRGVRAEASAIHDLDPLYGPFAARLEALAATYQSRAVLRLVEHHIQREEAVGSFSHP